MKIDARQLKTLREARGWSQEHLATVSGLSLRTVQRLESEGKASHESRMALAAALGIEPAQLLEAEVATPASAHVPTANKSVLALALGVVYIGAVAYGITLILAALLGAADSAADRRMEDACKANPAQCNHR